MTSKIGVKKIQYPNGTNSITIDSSGSAAITTANITTANITNATATGTITTPSINGSQIGGRRNMIINGAMQVAQRGTSASGSQGYLTCDRFQYNLVGTVGASTVTQNTVTDLPGFTKSLKVDVTTADASLAVSDRLTLAYKIEGQDIQQVAKGTSSAKQLTLSFYIKATKTGTQIVELFDHDNTRHCAKSVTINSSNTWEKKTITYPADTTGAFDNDNAQSLSIFFGIAVGTNFTSGTLATAWAANDNTNRFVGQVNHFDSTDNNFEITGVQLEVGSQATAFEHRSIGEELQLCKRYFQVLADGSRSQNEAICAGAYYTASILFHSVVLPVEMRSQPTMVTTNGTNYYITFSNGSGDHHDGIARSGNSSKSVVEIYAETNVGGTAGHACFTRIGGTSSDAKCMLDAEL